MSYKIEKSRSSKDLKDRIIAHVCDLKGHSERQHEPFYRRLSTLYNLYRGTMKSRMQAFRNNVHIPLIFTTIQSDVARKVETLFSDPQIVTFQGFGPNDAPYARKQGSIVSAQFEDSKILQKAIEVFLTGDLYGTAVIQFGWETKTRNIVQVTEETLPLSGETVRKEETIEYKDFDGPNFEVIDLLDFFPQPGYRNLDDMHWVIVRRWQDIEDCEDMAAEGRYDKDAVYKLKAEGAPAGGDALDYRDFRFANLFAESEGQSLISEPLGRPVEIYEFWGRLPKELCPDGNVHRVITVANGKFLLRNRPNPFWGARKPFLAYSPNPDPHFFFAIGKAEIIAKLQIVANRFTNQQLDVIDRAIDPAFIYNENSGLDPSRAHLAPNKWIGIDGPVDGQFAPITPDLRGVELGTAKTQEIWRWMQQATGIVEDVVVGLPSQRQTAREFLGRQEAIAVRLMLEARLAEKMFIEPLADSFMGLNKQFLDLPRQLTIIGESAEKDFVSGEPPQMERQIVTMADIIPTYAARARGAATRLGKGVRQQNLVLLMQAASANPTVAGAINWLAFFRTIFREFEIENANQLIATQEEFQRMQQLANGQGGQAQQPFVPGTPGAFAEELPANVGGF